MADIATRAGHDLNLASRKAHEAAWRRFQASEWLECLVGPLGISNQPSEREFISCLRNGLILCNAINKILPGSVPKVVESNHFPSQSPIWDSRPLPAYQFFENVRNFLKAVEELKLPAFEASVFERDNLEVGSSAKIVDCLLALKAYHERKQMTGGNGNGFYKPHRSPLGMHSVGRIPSQAPGVTPFDPYRRLDMSAAAACDKQPPTENEMQNLEDSIVKALADSMVETKENIDHNLLASFRNGNMDPIKSFSRILSSCLEEQIQLKYYGSTSNIKDILRERSSSPSNSASTSPKNSTIGNKKCCRACLNKGNCNHWQLFQTQEKELSNIKLLLLRTKDEFKDLQSQLQSDLKQMGSQVQELSTAALGYHKVVKENRNLYNMVQDLKGNIRVYCRIRPAFSTDAKNVIDFIGEDGSLVVVDPLKPQKDGRKLFQFNRVFGPIATQDEVFKDTQPLIRSVMDGYNVCIFAYGQTGSGKTHTMYGPSGGSRKELGINYLALNDLFQISNQRKDIIRYELYVQMVEIYNEQVRDLLAQDSTTTKLEIRSCAGENGLSLPDATLHSVKSTADVLNLMKLGEVNRAVSSTAMNNQSSRSHSVLTVHVHGTDVSGGILRSCLHLVDLAGSERVDKSEVTGDGLKEAQYINKSLSCLGDVITALAQKNSYIPYRNSKLTLLLQNSLGGNAKTLMFAHVSPEGDSFGETVSTLKFAQRASTVELGAARSNKESKEVMELKEQIESLKRALAIRELPNVQVSSKHKEPRSPFEKPKVMTDRTPPRSRRLSIENCSTIQMEKATNLANREAQHVHASKLKEPKSPFGKPKAMAELTPPRSRRLSIENCNTMRIEKGTNIEDKKGFKTPSVQTRSRRLSLEGSRNTTNKDPVQMRLSEEVGVENFDQPQDDETVLNSQRGPRSPIRTSVHKSRMVKTDGIVKIQPAQLPKTPERPIPIRNDAQIVSETRLPGLAGHTNGKSSHIRKSLRTIGKLINGSEKRSQQKLTEVATPLNSTISINDGKSPIPPSGRALRRQSLIGIQPPDNSRRTLLGGNPDDSCVNAKTPPPVHPSSKMKQWM